MNTTGCDTNNCWDPRNSPQETRKEFEETDGQRKI